MKIIRRNKLFVWLPSFILAIIFLNLIWEVIKLNLESQAVERWPWRLDLLDVPTSATLAGIIAGLLLTRAQFSQTMKPALGWRGYEVERSIHIEKPVWTVFLYNYGPGNCRIKKIAYSYTRVGHAPSGRKTWEAVVDELADAGMLRSHDYFLKNIGVGFTVPVSPVILEEFELAAFTEGCLAKLVSMNVELEIEDALGDVYARTIECLYTAHKIVQFRHGANNANSRTRNKRWLRHKA